ncbi:MAG: helix-hairpin-helix domain-containing protein [Dysgonamonadaceae bacterium]|jgi:DNA uptake protein ComE-like DNA-binding protein|nr:helix-hairpin-helix domain-containing protein [Dysgonamonadaceae bacterium]
MWRDFFHFTKGEQYGIMVLAALVAGIFIGKFLFETKSSETDTEIVEQSATDTRIYYSERPANGDRQDKPPVSSPPKDKAKRYYNNETGSSQGKYREETGTYYSQSGRPAERSGRDGYSRQRKLQKGEVIELNSADTIQLKMVPGIGSYYARSISNYRHLLGGYYRKEQLQEVDLMRVENYEKMVAYFYIDTLLITPIPVNTASLGRLQAHPYLLFSKAKAITDLRREKGRINSIRELEVLEEFTSEDLERLRVYLEF